MTGLVPSTRADDGDPLDIMVIHDAATFPGVVLTCRIIGGLQIEQKSKGKAQRNDRLFAVPRRARTRSRVCAMSGISRSRFSKSWRSFSSQLTSLKTKNWKSRVERPQDRDEGDPGQRQEFLEGRQVVLLNFRLGIIRSRAPPPLRISSACFARRPRSDASTPASSGVPLSTLLPSSISAFDAGLLTKCPSINAHATRFILSLKCRTRATRDAH
jgi:Inorganic pyrophosphatase